MDLGSGLGSTDMPNASHLDSHADTCAGGSNFVMMDPNQIEGYVDVAPFSDEYTPLQDIPVTTCVTAWTHPESGEVFLLVFGQMLYFGAKLSHSLLCPNQMRANGLTVHDTPTQFDSNSTHSITVHRDETDIVIPLVMTGVASMFESRVPTASELETCELLMMTSENCWDPHSPKFQEDESAAVYARQFSFLESEHHFRRLQSVCSRGLPECSIAEDHSFLSTRMDGTDSGDIFYAETRSRRHLNCLHRSIYSDTVMPTYMPTLSETKLKSKSPPKKKRGRVRFEDHASQPFVLNPEGSFEEGSYKRRKTWGPDVTVPAEVRPNISAEDLARRWNIGLNKAKATLRVTTQKGMRNLQNPLTRRLKTQRWRTKRVLKGKWFSDTMHFKCNSVVRQESAAQVFTNGKGYDEFYPIVKERNCSDGLIQLINEIGIPEHLIVDGARAQGNFQTYRTHWDKLVREYQIRQSYIQPHCWWQNHAEKCIGELRKEMRRLMAKRKSPKRLWNFLGQYVAGRRQVTSSNIPSMGGRTGFELVHGYTPDITLYTIHDWYEFVFWYDGQDKTEKLGRWLGPCKGAFGGGDCFYILASTAMVTVTNTTRPLTEAEWNDRDIQRQMDCIDSFVQQQIGEVNLEGYPYSADLFEEDDAPLIAEEEALMPEVDSYSYTPEEYDEYINAEVLLDVGDEKLRGIVKKRTHDLNGNPIGQRNPNPFLDTRSYEVLLPDGSTTVYGANIIAENVMSSVDDDGNMFVLLDEIIDHRSSDKALTEAESWSETKSGTKRRKPTTKGWELLISWKDGTTSWARLADMKESFPIEVSEYARANDIIDKPAFAWWCYHVLRKKDRLISGAKTKYWLKTHKYGIRLPKSIKEALAIDKETGTTFWRDAIAKEMKNAMVSFQFSDNDEIPVGHQKITVHMVFDVKITLTRKARLVADGHRVPDSPKETTYSSVPSRDSVRLFFLLAALNDLDVLSADIQNAYLTAPIKEKYYMIATAGDGFPPHLCNRPCKIVRALYGLPVAGASFRAYLAQHLRDLGYKSCKADPDVHMRPAVKENGDIYYEYMIAYVDDLLCCSVNPKLQMDMIQGKFTLKDGTVEEPKMYLGADIIKTRIEGSEDPEKVRWSMASTNYTNKAIADVERVLGTEEYGFSFLPKHAATPVVAGYRPEIDPTPELDQRKQNYYQGLIGVLRWICELGRLDIMMPVSLFSRYLAQAREGHLNQVFHIFAYLKQYNRSKIVFDDSLPEIDESRFHICDWTEFYPDAKEKLPPDMPEPRGKTVQLTCFVDADHAGCRETRRSHTGVLIFVNRAPILWYSKRQTTVETSTFGSEIVALRISVEMIEGLRYKLRMLGVPIDGPCDVFCDNNSVVLNTSRPESPLKKKHCSVAYHKARECIAAGIIRIAKEDGKTNIADILTKLVTGTVLRFLVGCCMWRNQTKPSQHDQG